MQNAERETVQNRTTRLAQMGILTAVSIMFVWLIHIPLIPMVPFIKYDPADIPILLGTLLFGPGAGLLITTAVSIIQGTLVEGGAYDAIMHILATGTLVLLASAVYEKKRTPAGARRGLLLGTLGMTAMMFLANLVITPIYMGVDRSMVLGLMPWILLFNLIKAGLNSLVSYLLCERLGKLLGLQVFKADRQH